MTLAEITSVHLLDLSDMLEDTLDEFDYMDNEPKPSESVDSDDDL